MLEPYFEQLIVVDPRRMGQGHCDVEQRPTAEMPAKLAMKLYRGELEPLYVPDPNTQDLRS